MIVPNCTDYVTFLMLRKGTMKVKRLYQCRCDVSQDSSIKSQIKEQSKVIKDDNKLIRNMIERGQLNDVQLELFSD